MKTEWALIGGALLGLYWYRHRITASFNPANPDNLANQAATTLYQQATGSTGTPGADLADWTHTDADAYSISVLEDFFTKQGLSAETLRRARDMGWTDTDIARATFWMPVAPTDW